MPLTADSMPRQPRLYNADRRLGHLVKLYVLGYPLSTNDLLKWADDNQIAPDKTKNNRCHLTWRAIFGRLPQNCRRWVLVTTEAGSLANCVVIATNDTPEDMKRAEDLETIRTVQTIMGVYMAPKWYKMVS